MMNSDLSDESLIKLINSVSSEQISKIIGKDASQEDKVVITALSVNKLKRLEYTISPDGDVEYRFLGINKPKL